MRLYTRIFNDVLDGSLADDFFVRHVFEDLLKLCDSDGLVEMTLSALARRLNIPRERLSAGIEALSSPDPESRITVRDGRRIVPIEEGRGWQIVNHGHYRDILTRDDKKKADRERVAARRAVSTSVEDCRDVSQAVASCPTVSTSVEECRLLDVDVEGDVEEEPESVACRRPPSPAVDEIEWRVNRVANLWLDERQQLMRRLGRWRGSVGVDRKELSKHIRKAIQRFDSKELLGPDRREDWERESQALAAARGILLSRHHIGFNDEGRLWLEVDRPWRKQRGKPHPTPVFAEIFFDHQAQQIRDGPVGLPAGLPPEPLDARAELDRLIAKASESLDADEADTWLGPVRAVQWDGETLTVAAPTPEFAHSLECKEYLSVPGGPDIHITC